MFVLVTTALLVLGTIAFYFSIWKARYRNGLFLSASILLPMLVQNFRRRKEINKLLSEESGDGRTLRASLRTIQANWSLYSEKINGIRLIPGAKAENVRALQSRLVMRADDVVVASYPKSGTTWIMQIVKLIRNNGVESGQDVEDAFAFVDAMTLAEAEVSSYSSSKNLLKMFTCISTNRNRISFLGYSLIFLFTFLITTTNEQHHHSNRQTMSNKILLRVLLLQPY